MLRRHTGRSQGAAPNASDSTTSDRTTSVDFATTLDLDRVPATLLVLPVKRVRLFISYRRADTQPAADRLHDHLVERIGDSRVFKDIDDIAPGEDVRTVIANAVRACDVMLVLIGRNWVSVRDNSGELRLNDPNDFVRCEIEAALQYDVRIVPLLVGQAKMPRQEALPATLRELRSKNAYPLRHDPDFHRDVERLCRKLGIPSHPRTTAPGLIGDAARYLPSAKWAIVVGAIGAALAIRVGFRDLDFRVGLLGPLIIAGLILLWFGSAARRRPLRLSAVVGGWTACLTLSVATLLLASSVLFDLPRPFLTPGAFGLRGTVLTEEGKPAIAAQVLAYDRMVRTDRNGDFNLTLPNPPYRLHNRVTLRVSLSGYVGAAITAELLGALTHVDTLTLRRDTVALGGAQ